MKRVLGIVAAFAVLSFAGMSARAEEGEGAAKPKVEHIRGEISKIEGKTITIAVKREGETVKEQALTVDDNTKIRVQTDEMETITGEGGQTRQRAKWADGKLEDLKVGQRVSAGYVDNTAKVIEVPKPETPRKGGEGEGKLVPAPAPKEGGEKHE